MRKIAIGGLLSMIFSAQAQIALQTSRCYIEQSAWFADARLALQLSDEALTALKSGISLYFILHAQQRTEHWWQSSISLSEHIWQLRYNHLSFSYLLQKDNQTSQQYSDIDSALKALGTIERLPLKATHTQTPIALRFQLSQAHLPFSLRLNALFSKAWTLDSGWWQCQQ